MKSLKDFILEKEMKFEKKFELEFTINKSFHATERQSRHGDDEEHFISDDEILETVKKASKTIIEDIINDNINIDDRFIVRDANTDFDKFWNTKQNWVVMVR